MYLRGKCRPAIFPAIFTAFGGKAKAPVGAQANHKRDRCGLKSIEPWHGNKLTVRCKLMPVWRIQGAESRLQNLDLFAGSGAPLAGRSTPPETRCFDARSSVGIADHHHVDGRGVEVSLRSIQDQYVR
jgi:hypothetical protein